MHRYGRSKGIGMTQQQRTTRKKPGAAFLRPLEAAVDALIGSSWEFREIGPDELRYPATISLWLRWCICAVCVFQLVYRPVFDASRYTGYILCFIVLVAFNGYFHYLHRAGHKLTLHLMLAISATDMVLITAAMAIGGGFSHYFFYLLYYPALAWFAVFFSSYRLSFAWVTVVAVAYTIVSLTVGEGLDFEARDDKALIARIVVMYVVVASVNLLARSERIRRLEAVARERELQRQRLEISQTIHDTTAQSAYTLGLGLEDAIEKAGKSDPELVEKLEAMWSLTRSTMWALRHPIDGGQIFSGSTLSEVLAAHADTFTVITSIPAEVEMHGVEPQLSTVTRSLLFTIAHNALTNAFRHSDAENVMISLEFGGDDLRLSVSDDGVGLPDDYAVRGHGFRNMRSDAERMGGSLNVQSNGNGTTVSCAVPYLRGSRRLASDN